MLVNGPPGRRPQEDKVNWHKWYQQLDHISQENVEKIATQAVDDALFSLFAILDRASGGLPIKGTLSDFAIYLQSYESEENEAEDLPTTRVKLNPWSAQTDLHDLYRWQVEETNSTGEAT